MMTLCSTLHTMLRFRNRDDDRRRRSQRNRCRNIPTSYDGGLRILAGDAPRRPNVLESSAIGRPPERVDPGTRGLHELDYHGGFSVVTEGLGSESCDGGLEAEEMAKSWGWSGIPRCRRAEARMRPPPPPPLSWLVGRRSRFMRAVKECGRFRLTEVRFERPPEILRASRSGGRLRLDFVVRSDREENEEAAVIAEQEEVVDDGDEEDIEEEEEVRAPPVVSPKEMVMPTRKGEERRCQATASSHGVPMWWNHRPIIA
ncbi:hypothetical protein C4D60_Mb01t06830 [Musa balbisiana]|uniref:FAF domain-containing protein n=1 Tax=Musa balbisiana TaxID=52838 RepID=A0A4S8JKM1_MUSBA|nr:hypothetical protein C4D60_Mb01t06830 [Musa balbisiana]